MCLPGLLCCLCGVLGHLTPAHRCARWVCSLFVRCTGPLGSCSPVCPLAAFLCVCGVLGHLAPVHRCTCSVCCFACAVSSATQLLFTGVPARCVVLLVRCPGPLGSCSPACPFSALLCVCGVMGHLAPVHRCGRVVCCVACAVSWVTGLLFSGVPGWFVVLRVRCPGPLDSCSLVCPLGALLCVCGVLGHLAPVHRCARSVYCFACAVSWATQLLFTGVPARCVVLLVRCPGPLGSCSPACPFSALLCVCGVIGHLASVHRCACSVCCFACAVSWATSLLFTAVPARCVVLLVRCPWPLGSCSPKCLFGVLCCVCTLLGHLAPVHRCARSVCCFACAVSWATWLLLTGVPACRVACVFGVLGHLAPVHRCACSVCCFACAVSWATWLLFTGVPVRCVALRMRCPGRLGSCSPVCTLGVLFCLCGVLGHLAPVHRCARSSRCLCVWCPAPLGSCSPVCPLGALFCVWCPGPLGSCSPMCLLGVLFRLCHVLGHFAPVHRCAVSVRCFACAVSWAT